MIVDAWGVKVELDEFSPSFFDVVVVLDYGALGADNDLKVVWRLRYCAWGAIREDLSLLRQ